MSQEIVRGHLVPLGLVRLYRTHPVDVDRGVRTEEVVRRVVGVHGGTEVQKHIMLFAFEQVSLAIASAVAVAVELRAQGIPAACLAVDYGPVLYVKDEEVVTIILYYIMKYIIINHQMNIRYHILIR